MQTNHTNTLQRWHAQKRPSWRYDPVAIPTQTQTAFSAAQEECDRSVKVCVCVCEVQRWMRKITQGEKNEISTETHTHVQLY